MRHFLIVVDMQRDFVDGALGSPEAQAIVPAAVRKIGQFDGAVFATLDTHYDDYMQTAEGAKLPVPHCIKGTDGWRLHPPIADALEKKGSTLIEKNTFGSTALPGAILRAANGEPFTLEVIGLCTDICVVSNALMLKAYFPEAPIAVDASCCAGVTPALHEAALQTMRSCQIDVV